MSRDKPVITKPRAIIDLDAVVANYRTVQAELGPVTAAAVVKADGYGLGAIPVATALAAAGCDRFFVARADEGIALRAGLAEAGHPNVEINVFDGPVPGTERELAANRLVPIINSLEQLAGWTAAVDDPQPVGLHIDTGMARLGIPRGEYEQLLASPELLAGVEVRHVMSHLASADITDHPQSKEQLRRFELIRQALPAGTASLANSAGVFLGADYHFDLARPGISLYGGSPFPDSGRPNPMVGTVTVEAPIVQLRTAEPGETVGYGATHCVTSTAKIATVPVGYADGYLRSASSQGVAAIGGRAVPIVGRISMDLITIDVTDIDERDLHLGAPVELIGPSRPIDDVAERAGSLPHEFLTRLGPRYERAWRGGAASPSAP